jgi:hypothetical protein
MTGVISRPKVKIFQKIYFSLNMLLVPPYVQKIFKKIFFRKHAPSASYVENA